jgi:hypothetical protein
MMANGADPKVAVVNTLRYAELEYLRPGIQARRDAMRADPEERDADVKLALWDRYERILETFSAAGVDGADESLVEELLEISKYILPQEVPDARALAKAKGVDQMLANVTGYDHYQITDAVDGVSKRAEGAGVKLSAIRATTLFWKGKTDPEIADELCTLADRQEFPGRGGSSREELHSLPHKHGDRCSSKFAKQRAKLATLISLSRK